MEVDMVMLVVMEMKQDMVREVVMKPPLSPVDMIINEVMVYIEMEMDRYDSHGGAGSSDGSDSYGRYGDGYEGVMEVPIEKVLRVMVDV